MEVTSGLREVPIGQIEPNPQQPRQRFARGALEDLAQSIRDHGIVQPLERKLLLETTLNSKPPSLEPATASNKVVQRIELWTWILIYAGLLALILGWWVLPSGDGVGYLLLGCGALIAVIGFFMIYVRSKISADS